LRGIVRDLVGEIGLLGACVWSEGSAGLAVSECVGESPDHSLAKRARETGEPVVSGDCMAWPLLVRDKWVGALAVRGDLPEPTRAIVGMLAGRCAHIVNDARAAAVRQTLLGGLSHELRAPLQSLLGHLDLLRTGTLGTLAEPQGRALESVGRNSEKVLAIIGDVLQVSRIDAGFDDVVSEEFPLCEALEGEAEDARPLAVSRGLQLEVSCDGPIALQTDGAKVRRIVMNLLSNGIKYTKEGRVTLRGFKDGDVAVIEVSDTGSGIPEDQVERVFEEYVRLDPDGEGSGLGLPIARRLARLLGGTLDLASAPGQGTTATLRLPVCRR